MVLRVVLNAFTCRILKKILSLDCFLSGVIVTVRLTVIPIIFLHSFLFLIHLIIEIDYCDNIELNPSNFNFNYEEVSEGNNLEQNITLKRGDVIVVR